MADCNETLRELEAFLDSELSEETHLAIHTHLEQCPDCLQAFDFHAELKIVVAQKCRSDEMPAGLLLKIEQCFGLDPDLGPDASVGDIVAVPADDGTDDGTDDIMDGPS